MHSFTNVGSSVYVCLCVCVFMFAMYVGLYVTYVMYVMYVCV